LGWHTPGIAIDEGAEHLGLIHDGAVVAVASHTRWPCPDEPDVPARYFWAMAVTVSHRRRGLGRRLLVELASRARANGEHLLWADARDSAVGFYAACGAEVRGGAYVDEVTGLTDRRVVLVL